MSKETRKLFEAIKDGAGKVWDALEHPAAHGAHEVAAALFQGHGFVMYPRAGQEGQGVEDPKHGLPEQAKEVDLGREI